MRKSHTADQMRRQMKPITWALLLLAFPGISYAKILRFEVLDRVRICIPANQVTTVSKGDITVMKRAAVVRSKHIVSGAVLALGIMCPALSS
jgi:hypothetical protein